jgi:cytochrome c
LNSFELNKIAGAFLGTLLFAMWLNVISSAIFPNARLLKPAYPLPSAPEMAAAGGGAPAPSVAPIEERLAKADVKKGEASTKPCQACHNFEKGAGIKIGPPLYDVVGRPKDAIAGFAYSDALKAKSGKWSYEDLDQFLTSPKTFAQGTKMAFAGEADPVKRADIIDYLHTLADNPEPLPASVPAQPKSNGNAEPSLSKSNEHAVSGTPAPPPASGTALSAPAAGGAETPLPQLKEHAVPDNPKPLPANGSHGKTPPRKRGVHSSKKTRRAGSRRN